MNKTERLLSIYRSLLARVRAGDYTGDLNPVFSPLYLENGIRVLEAELKEQKERAATDYALRRRYAEKLARRPARKGVKSA